MVCALSSGAQTSVDRAALDWAIFRDIPHSGLRFQSEVEGLRWSDVDWAESRFTVHEKKVEHHPGRVPRKSGTNSVTKKRGGHHGRAKGGHRGVR